MATKKEYSEAELVELFNLIRVENGETPLMQAWLAVENPTMDIVEQTIFDRIYQLAANNIRGWGEEELKMKFISQILPLGHIFDTDRYITFYEKTVSGIVEGISLTAKTDFMVATGILNMHKKPYFHFQEYKPLKNPTGDSMGQLLEAMLIGQQRNSNGKPMYGCEIIGKTWNFVVLKDRTYCVSKIYNCITRTDLLQIIAILRHFKRILETELL